MDYEAIDRAMSRAVVKITYPNGVTLWLSDNTAETATDIKNNVRRFSHIGAAWDACDRIRSEFRGATVEAVSVLEMLNGE